MVELIPRETDMVRTEISLFLKNAPGELAKLSFLLSDAGINIDALTIQDASSYVQELFQARGKSIKRIASVANYSSIKMDSREFALIRLLADNSDQAIDILSKHDYIFDIMPVIAIKLDNKPGTLADVTDKIGKAGINLNYVYGSVSSPDTKCLFVFSPDDMDRATKLFNE